MARAVPRFELPPTRERYWVGILSAVAIHIAALILLLASPEFDEQDFRRGIGSPALAVGGGGGGAGRAHVMHFVSLDPPAATRQAEESRPLPVVVETPTVVPPVEPPLPEIADQLPEQEEFDVELPVVAAQVNGAKGMGVGPGSGGGIGSGQGEGIGSGRGPGTGGEGGDVLAPMPRASPFPFHRPPAEVDGVEFTVRFFVNERGRVERVRIEPEIADRGYRDQVMQTFESWTFYAARTLAGRPVQGQYVLRFIP
jgi:protein TonB